MAFIIRKLDAQHDDQPVYLGILVGTGTLHNVSRADAKQYATREAADAAREVLGEVYGAANLATEDADEPPAKTAEELFMENLLTAIALAEEWMPQSGKFTLEQMSALRLAMSRVVPQANLKV
jgi:hypothetical protein